MNILLDSPALFPALGGFLVALLFFIFYYQRKRNQLLMTNQRLEQRLAQHERELATKSELITLLQSKTEHYQQQVASCQRQYAAAEATMQQQAIWREKHDALQQELQLIQSINSRQHAELRELATRLQETRRAAEEKQALLTDSELRLSEQFENLSNRLFDINHRKMDEQNRKSVNSLLIPLREQLDNLRRQTQDSLNEESKARHLLTHEIQQLQLLNRQMAQDAINLTNALKGNNKTQGNWGEIILNRILEASGLRQNHEYKTQVSMKSSEGERQQPDVIVHLPHQRVVIIDAKVTLVAYEKYYNCDDEQEKKLALAAHITAIKTHIRTLSQKAYQALPAQQTLDYVLLFIPIDAALALALEQSPSLLNEALKQHIMLVSPTSLMIALRTIENLWRYEHQNQNAQLIAAQAAKIYDKLRLFVEEMNTVGTALQRADMAHQAAIKKLSHGKGNLIGQVEQFRHWGVEIKKPIELDVADEHTDRYPASAID